MKRIEFKGVNYIYSKGTNNESKALTDINVSIGNDEFVAIIGHTGSGKSTFIQLMNGLIKADSGEVLIDGKNINSKEINKKDLRCKVGLVFQHPENQLFEETVLKDVCFGPRNQGFSKEEAIEKAKKALALVEIDEKFFDMSVFELSGGQKRRVAIAGVLAMEPDILILDEPTAGLDPEGRDKIMSQIARLHKESGVGIIWVSHNMEQVAKYAKRIIVMNKGSICYDASPKVVFDHYKDLEKIGLKTPQITAIMHKMKEAGFDVDTSIINIEEAKKEILRVLGK